jgi:predicted O-linked N-acetylglucosamine transferase (SPINDLY family)
VTDWARVQQDLVRQVTAWPGDALAWSNLSYAALRCGDLAQASAAATRACELAPGMAGAWINRSAAFLVAGDSTGALAFAQHAQRCDPDSAEALVAVGAAARETGSVALATGSLLEAVRRAPQIAEGWCNLALVLSDQAQNAGAADSIARACALAPERIDLASNRQLIAQYHGDFTSSDLRAAAAGYGATLAHAGIVALPPAPPRGPGPLRVAYLSPDLRAHPVGFLLRDVLPAHDPARLSVTVYATTPRADWLTAELQSAVPRWHEVGPSDDAALAQRIRADDIDVLVDLCGHTAHNRLGVLARLPARRHFVFLGWFAGVGVPGIDGLILGSDQFGPAAQSFLAEPPVAVPGTQFRYRPAPYAPEVAPLPAQRAGGVTFASFNNTAKLNAQVVQCWADLLHAVPGSRLLLQWKSLSDPAFRATLQARFARLGVDPARVQPHGASDHVALLSRYAEVDIALDPFPFPGGMTSLEALTQGVPVVTLSQERPVSRQTAAMLDAIGLRHLVARTQREYVAAAVALAADLPALAALRAGLRARVARSILGDPASLARALDDLYAGASGATSTWGA